jgi:Ca2+-transporting ATPase
MSNHEAEAGTLSTWWTTPARELAERIGTDLSEGLESEQVEVRRWQYGSNYLEDEGPTSLWTLALESVRSPMMLLLLSIAGISLLLGQIREALVMVFVVAMYVGIHLLNKARADRTMARLREVQAPTARVLREGQVREVPTREIVVGDILPLQAGTRLPADGRLFETAGLLLDEAALTGESSPVRKDAGARLDSETPLAERVTAVFSGTTVLDGQGKALVAVVGDRTELGRVAALAMRVESDPTPLQKEMDSLARILAYVAVAVSLLIPLLGLLRGFDLQQMILTWLSLTFLMVPGQPPIIIAMALALASLELARKEVIVRRLQAAETLGAVTALLSDKTGTITENRMVLEGVLLPDGTQVEVEDPGKETQALARFFQGALQAIPDLVQTNDPTDLAVVNAASSLQEGDRPERGRLVDQIGFARSGTYRALDYDLDYGRRTFVTGEPEFVIQRSESYQTEDGSEPWPREARMEFEARLQNLAAQGKRVTAYGYLDGGLSEGEIQGLVFLGVAIIGDPIRRGVGDAVERLKDAGIRVLMITGDIAQTAEYVARKVGLNGDAPVTGRELEGRSEADYDDAVRQARVFARATPEQKLRLVQALQRQDEVVAVTGDGVNDAPALSTAHVGIAMGRRGTDVAREAADLILTDDNLAHLPDGVAIGRKAYDNFAKGITYYLSAKAILLSIFVVPLIVGVAFPLAPIQIIVTELLMDLASSTIFVTEEAEPDLLKRQPRRRTGFLSWRVAGHIVRNSAGLVTAILAVYFGSVALGYGVDSARTAAFATWLLGHIVLAMNLKQRRMPLLQQGLLANRFAFGWLVGMILLVLAMTFVAPVRSLLKTTSLSGIQWLGVVLGSVAASGWMEVIKAIRSAKRKGNVRPLQT